MLKKYKPFLRAGAIDTLTYRFNILIWAAITVCQVACLVFLWLAVYRSSAGGIDAEIHGFTFREMNKTYGTTVVLTTHDMTDIEHLCSRIILLEKGSILYDGALKSLKNRFGNLKTLTLTVPAEMQSETVPVLSPDLAVSEEDGRMVLRFDADKIALEQVIQYAFRDLRAMDMKIAEISIGDVVKTILAQQEAEHAEKI